MTRKRGWLHTPLIPSLESLTPQGARVVLSMRLGPEVVDRMDELAGIVRRRALTDTEKNELDFLLNLGSVLSIMHSKARMALKRPSERESRRKSA